MRTFRKNISPNYLGCIFLLVILAGCSKAAIRSQNSSALGAHYFAENNYAKSAEYFEKALGDNPDRKDSLTMLGWAYFKQGNYDASLAIFEKLAALDPKALDAYTGRGWSSFKKGNYDQAISFFEEAIKIDANSSDPYDGIGWCSSNKGDTAKAEEYFNIALRKGMKFHKGLKSKTDPEAHRGLGYLYFGKGDFNTALRHFKMASLLMPNTSDWNDVRVKWGDCLLSLQKYGDAVGVYKHCLKAKRSAEIYDKMGWGYFQLAESTAIPALKNHRYNAALKMFNKALGINPQFESSLSGAAKAQAKITTQ